MTVQEVVLDLLQFIGVTGFAPVDGANALNRPGLDDLDTNKAVAAVNAALQTIQKFGPLSMKQGERAAFLNNPTLFQVDVDATNAQSITFASTPPSWIAGCSILVAGDTDLNRVSDITGNDVSLVRGYRGMTASGIMATVYADCSNLPEDVLAVLEPVIVSPNTPLIRARDLEEFYRLTADWSHFTHVGSSFGYGTSKPVGTPGFYYVEKRFDGTLYLRVSPSPAAATNVTYQAKLAPQIITTDSLELSGGADPGDVFTNLSAADVESVLLPLARGKFLTHPALKNRETRASIQTEFDRVMLSLENGSVFESSVGKNTAVYI